MNQINWGENIFCWWNTPPTNECEAHESLVVFIWKPTSIQSLQKRKKSMRIWFQSWEYKSSLWFGLFWKAPGHSRSCGRLAAWQMHGHKLLDWSVSFVESLWTATQNFLSNWLMYEFTKTFHPGWLEPEVEVEATDIIRLACIPVLLFISSKPVCHQGYCPFYKPRLISKSQKWKTLHSFIWKFTICMLKYWYQPSKSKCISSSRWLTVTCNIFSRSPPTHSLYLAPKGAA